MQQDINISSDAFQMVAWGKLQQSIFNLLDKVNAINIGVVRKQLLQLNIMRGKGIFCEFITQIQSVSIGYTHVYATLVASINLVFPIIGELLLVRCIMLFKEAYYQNVKSQCKASAMFIAHLVNHSIVDEILVIDILKLLIKSPNKVSIEISLDILNTCGKKISNYYKKEMDELFDAMQIVINDTHLDEQVQHLIKTIIDLHENGFKINQLDSVPDDGQKMHLLTLESSVNINDIIGHYEFDPNYAINEINYKLAAMGLQESDSEDEDKENKI